MSPKDSSLPVAAAAATSSSRPDCCVLEIGGELVGLLITEKHGLVFHAASQKTWPLDRRVFTSIEAAERAIRALLSSERKKSVDSQPLADR